MGNKKSSKELLFERMYYMGMPKKKLNEDEMGMEDIEAAADNIDDYEEAPSYQVKLDNICEKSRDLHDKIEVVGDLPAWVQDKITIAEHNMKAIHDWLESKGHGEDREDSEMNGEEPEMDTDTIAMSGEEPEMDSEDSEDDEVKISDDDMDELTESKKK